MFIVKTIFRSKLERERETETERQRQRGRAKFLEHSYEKWIPEINLLTQLLIITNNLV